MKTLQDVVDANKNLVDYFYNDTISPYHKSRTSLFAAYMEPEYTNWRDEQRAWRETAVLFNQSHHMPALYIKGPDAKRLLTSLAINSFTNLTPNRAKQFIACTPRGHIVGDCIAYFHGDEDGFELISGTPVLNWVRFHGGSGEFNVHFVFDPTTPFNPTGKRTKYRFQVEGPHARKILEEVVEGGFPEIKFFHTAYVKIAGCRAQVLRHGMAGHAGAEISGPYDELEIVRSAILKAGEKYDLKQSGTKAYWSTPLENGWMSHPLPGIYTGEELRPYREWLPADSWEANAQLGGSLYSDNIEDFYVTPWCLGYGHLVKFDHDFIGRSALEESLKQPKRTKRTLQWNRDDVLRVFASQFGDGPVYKSIERPNSFFGWPQADEVRSLEGQLIGMSQYCGYNVNERDMISLAWIKEEFAEIGTEVVLTWGEINGGSRKPHVERHEQTKIRAIVSPVPYAKGAREKLRATI